MTKIHNLELSDLIEDLYTFSVLWSQSLDCSDRDDRERCQNHLGAEMANRAKELFKLHDKLCKESREELRQGKKIVTLAA